MLRLCTKCSFRLKKIDENDDFTFWECTNPECKESYQFPVEKKVEVVEEVEEEVEEEIVVNVPKYDKDFKPSVNIEKKESEYEVYRKHKEELLKQYGSSSKVFFKPVLDDDKKFSSFKVTKIDDLKRKPKIEEVKEEINNENSEETIEEVVETQQDIVEEFDEFKEEFFDDNEEIVEEETVEEVEKEYDPYAVDLDVEDVKYPITWIQDEENYVEQTEERHFTIRTFLCPICASQNFNITQKVTTCNDCGNKYINLKINTEFYYGLCEATEERQKANFKKSISITKELIEKYPEEDLTDALINLGLSESNIIFRKDIKTGKRIATVYSLPENEIDFSDNESILKALEIARDKSKIKYELLTYIMENINSYYENFRYILKHNNRYEVFICYPQSESTHNLTKGLLLNLNKMTKSFVVGRANEVVDENRDIMSKIYYGLNSAKIMVLLCTSKEELESETLKWRYETFLSVDRQKYIIPVLMNGMKKEDLPEFLQSYEVIEDDKFTILNVQKQIHKLLPTAYMNQAYLEEKLNKIEECLINQKFIETIRRCDRLSEYFKENPYVYFYRLLAKNEINNEELIERIHEDLKDNEDFILAKTYADDELLERLLKYEYTNNKLQKLRRKQEKIDKIKNDIIKFLSQPAMQYVYTTILPVMIGLIILFTGQAFTEVESMYLFGIVGVLFFSMITLVIVCKFRFATLITLIASILFVFGTTSINRINFLNVNGAMFKYDYNIEDKTCAMVKTSTIFGAIEDSIDIIIPETVEIHGETYTVTEIGRELFTNAYKAKTIYIPKTVVNIEPYAFKDITATIIFDTKSQMTKIGDYAFSGYRGNEIRNLPSKLEVIGDYAFEDCINLYNENLDITSVKYTFKLPSTVKEIGKYAFYNVWCGIEFSENSELKVIKEYAFAKYEPQTKFSLPYGVEKIEKYAFIDAMFSEFYIPPTVKEIEPNAFEDLLVHYQITMPITNIDTTNIVGDSSVLSVLFGSQEKLNESKFFRLFVNNCVEELPQNMFKNCVNFTYIVFEDVDSLKVIGKNAFTNCINLKTLEFEGCDNIYQINEEAFSNCINLECDMHTLPKSVIEIKENAFLNCVKFGDIKENSDIKYQKPIYIENLDFLNSLVNASEANAMGGLLYYCDKIYINPDVQISEFDYVKRIDLDDTNYTYVTMKFKYETETTITTSSGQVYKYKTFKLVED